jgi:hypothetical protein
LNSLVPTEKRDTIFRPIFSGAFASLRAVKPAFNFTLEEEGQNDQILRFGITYEEVLRFLYFLETGWPIWGMRQLWLVAILM